MKKWLLVAAGVLASLALAQNITVWTALSGPNLTWLKSEAKSYQGATGVAVNVVSVPFADLQQKFILGAPTGKGPDLAVTIPQDQLGQMVAAGVLSPMTDYATSSYLSDLMPVARQAFTYAGKLYGLPLYVESVALIYNKKYIQTPPKNWVQFLELAKKFTNGQTFGFLAPIDTQYYDYGFWKAFGGYIFKQGANGVVDTSAIGLGGQAGYQAGQFLKDLRYKWNLVPTGADYNVADSAFKDGALAMILNGPWGVGGYKKAGIDFGVAPFPTPPGAKQSWGPFVGVQGVIMSAYSQHKIEAVNFAKYLVGPPAQVAFSKAGGSIPASRSAQRQLKGNSVVRGFSQVVAMGTPMPNLPAMGKVWGPWGDAVSLILRSANSNVKQIIDTMNTNLNKALSGK